MLLKCRYLANLTVEEISKNSTKILQIQTQCPFMRHANKSFSTTGTSDSISNKSLNQAKKTGKIIFFFNYLIFIRFYRL